MATPPTFSTRTVALALGLPVSTINHWFQTGLLQGLDCAQTEDRVGRIWSFEDACHVGLLAKLLRLGVKPQPAAWLCQTAIDAADLKHVRALEYREYPGETQATVTFDGADARPGCDLMLSIDLHVLFAATAANLRAVLKAAADRHAFVDFAVPQ